MTDAVLALVPTLGPGFVALIAALGCFGVPVPASIALVIAGALAAGGDMSLPLVLGSAYLGAVLGDHGGFALGRLAGAPIERFLSGTPKRARTYARALRMTNEWGRLAVFFSRWLVSPLGPAVNVTSGAGQLPLWRFTSADLLGEAVWVGLYVGLGFAFSSSVAALAAVLSDAVWLLMAAGAALLLGVRLRAALRAPAT